MQETGLIEVDRREFHLAKLTELEALAKPVLRI
jgi:hypothetical protein